MSKVTDATYEMRYLRLALLVNKFAISFLKNKVKIESKIFKDFVFICRSHVFMLLQVHINNSLHDSRAPCVCVTTNEQISTTEITNNNADLPFTFVFIIIL